MRCSKTESNPPIQQSGNSIRIGYDLPDDVKRHVSINYEITVPPDTSVQGHSGSGNIGRQWSSLRGRSADGIGRHPHA